MEKEKLLNHIAPCSLLCYTCTAYAEGIICQSANTLLHHLDGICEFNQIHNLSSVSNTKTLLNELEMYGAGLCSGCRNRTHHTCSIQGCFILECTKEHFVDFCGECNEFPCTQTRGIFEDEVYQKWLNGNQDIHDHGIEQYWNSHCKESHYNAYKRGI